MVWFCSCKMNKKQAGCSPPRNSSMPTPCCHNNGNSNISISTGLLSTVRSQCSGSSLYISKTYTTQHWSSAQCLSGISNRIIHPKLRKSTQHYNYQNLKFLWSTRIYNFSQQQINHQSNTIYFHPQATSDKICWGHDGNKQCRLIFHLHLFLSSK